uniref:Uncharacterized protein n=1 Tax=Globodera rostochiensis TaxID=31243 RepID=A0A914GU81_GLORO
MIGNDGLNDNLIRARLLQRIGPITARIGQVRRMLNTTLVDFREIWQLVAGFDIDKDSSEAMYKLIEKVGQEIDKMLKLIDQNGGNYYRDKQPFEDAKNELLLVMTSSYAKTSQKKRMAQILKIVPTLWATASTDMLQNVVNDLLGPSNHFYGFTFLIEFGRQLHSANVLIYEGILNDSTLNNENKDKIKAPFNQMIAKAVQLFEDWKNIKINQLEIIGIRLRREMNNQWEQNWAAFMEVGVTIKRKQLIDNLLQIQNVFANVYDELEMMDLIDSCKMMRAKLDVMENILKSLKIDSSDDEMLISDAILSCLRTEELENSIDMESSMSSTNDIWNFKF